MFSRVVSMEEALAYTSCSQAGWQECKFQKLQTFFEDLRGDVASWEKEDEWETVGKVETVVLRLFFSITATNICSGRMTSAQRLDRKEERG